MQCCKRENFSLSFGMVCNQKFAPKLGVLCIFSTVTICKRLSTLNCDMWSLLLFGTVMRSYSTLYCSEVNANSFNLTCVVKDPQMVEIFAFGYPSKWCLSLLSGQSYNMGSSCMFLNMKLEGIHEHVLTRM